MTRVAATEAGKLGYGVRVNCIYPGLIPTDMGMQLANDIVRSGSRPTSTRRSPRSSSRRRSAGSPRSPISARPRCFLCSNEARFITGVGLPVDGGMGT